MAALTLNVVAGALGWPAEQDLLSPEGSGSAIFARLAQEKIGRPLGRLYAQGQVKVAVLSSDPWSEDTKSPLALLIEFDQRASAAALREVHRLSWNFSHSPTVITIEPHLLRVWSCCEPPSEQGIETHLVHEVEASSLLEHSQLRLQEKAARALHWLNLVSGHFFEVHQARFERDGRADRSLLRNLRFFRDALRSHGLREDDVCHDLLARVIFVQFLFDRRDADGVAALNEALLKRLHSKGVLSHAHSNLEEILSDYEDSYRLFDWLNVRFNGDLFPGKGETDEERAAGWATEREVVKPQHLALLADFIGGKIDGPSGQRVLWSLYSFDVIPLEFLSSIYETFVSERAAREGIYYTPPQLVDFVLDRVLPWRGTVWDLTVLDPACGSGIFLVKAFQRLVERWKMANVGEQIPSKVLQRLLSRNLFGVDKDPHAVRVACFSLYLAMCDEIEPRHYWSQVRFPSMRDRRLVCSDFFDEGPGFDSRATTAAYDLIVGNVPWGNDLAADKAREWARAQSPSWQTGHDASVLFMVKGANLLKPDGRLALIQSATSLLFNSSAPTAAFRQRLFREFKVDEVYNFSALRFRIFKGKKDTKISEAPISLIVMRGSPPGPDDDSIAYISPKAAPVPSGELVILVEPDDFRWIGPDDAIGDPFIWTALMRGTPRDLLLLRRLKQYPTLASLASAGKVRRREGVIAGNQETLFPHLSGRRLFKDKNFPEQSLIYLDATKVPRASEIRADKIASKDFTAFELPQLLIKQTWQKKIRRFQARLIRSSEPQGVLCSQSYVSVTGCQQILEAACLTYNSALAAYFLQLTSGRIAAYRPEAPMHELLNVPIPTQVSFQDIEKFTTRAELDAAIFAAFQLKDAERALVEDMVDFTMGDFKGERPGLRPTATPDRENPEETLTSYAKFFCRVLKAGFGADKGIRVTIFSPQEEALPYRLVAFELTESETNIHRVVMETPALLDKLDTFSKNGMDRVRGTSFVGRTARLYDGHGPVPTIFMLKPDAIRYWTRTAALNDADEVAVDLFGWLSASQGCHR